MKDLIRYLKREDDTCDVRRQLCHAQIVQNDLLPLLVHYSDDEALWETLVRSARGKTLTIKSSRNFAKDGVLLTLFSVADVNHLQVYHY